MADAVEGVDVVGEQGLDRLDAVGVDFDHEIEVAGDDVDVGDVVEVTQAFADFGLQTGCDDDRDVGCRHTLA